MSFTKRFIEQEEYNDHLIAALRHLDENDILPENQMRGIARTIIKKQRPENLNTEAQRWEFFNHIKPFLENILCENSECNTQIGIDNLEQAFDHKDQYGLLLCPDCLINKGREEHYASKDP